MPNWIRILFLKYLPIFLFMRRPKKTRLRWMMEIPGTSRKIPSGPPPINPGAGLGGMSMPDGGLRGLSPPGYPQVILKIFWGFFWPLTFCQLQGPDKPLPPVPGGMGGTPPPPPAPGGHHGMRTGSMNDLDRKNAIEVMELSDMHHPSCKLSQSRQGSFDDDADEVCNLFKFFGRWRNSYFEFAGGRPLPTAWHVYALASLTSLPSLVFGDGSRSPRSPRRTPYGRRTFGWSAWRQKGFRLIRRLSIPRGLQGHTGCGVHCWAS